MKKLFTKKIILTFILTILISGIFGLYVTNVYATDPTPTPAATPKTTPAPVTPSPVASPTAPPSASPTASTSPAASSAPNLGSKAIGGTSIGKFFEFTLSQAINPSISASNGKNKAANSKTTWIFDIWNWSLSLVNVIVAGVLIFLAFVNILHIQYDTYALKKSLPTLIMAIILANFSLLICRMFVDFSDVVTRSFVGGDPQVLAKALNDALGLTPSNLIAQNPALLGTGILACGVAVFFLGMTSGVTLIALLVVFIFAILPTIGILILAFLLYIRVAVLYVIVAVSPLAFICIALPSTQGFFKQWFSQFTKWVFMAPIVFLMLKIVSMVRSDQFSPLTYIIGLVILYLCIQVPFKMGGAAMAAWGGLGKKLGTRMAGGLGRNLESYMDSKKMLTPSGLWRGMISSAQRKKQAEDARQIGMGERKMEQVLSGPKWDKAEGKLKWGKEQLGMSEAEIAQRNVMSNRATSLGNSTDSGKLREFLNGKGDFNDTTEAYLALASKGEASPEDQKKYIAMARKHGQLDQANLAESLVKDLSTRGNANGTGGHHYLVSALTTENGKVRERTSKELRDDYGKIRTPGETTSLQKENLAGRVKATLMSGDKLLNESEFTNEAQHALAKQIGSFAKDHEFIANNTTMVKANAKYKIEPGTSVDSGDLRAKMPGTSADVIEHLSKALQDPEALNVDKVDNVVIAHRIKSVSDNFSNIESMFEQQQTDLHSKLQRELQGIVKTESGKVIKLDRTVVAQLHTKLKELHPTGHVGQEKVIEALFKNSQVYENLERAAEKYSPKMGKSKQTIDKLIKNHENAELKKGKNA